MPGEPYKVPEVTSEMKIKYYLDAERKYRTMPEDKLQKEYNRLIKGKTPWEWFKERVGSFINMVKIAALSVFLGRQETARRIQFGNRDAEFEKIKNEAKKEAKITVLEEKLNTLTKEREDKEKDSLEKPEEEKTKEEKDQNEKNSEALEQEGLDNKNPQPNKQEEQSLPGNTGNTSISIFAEQIEYMTDKFQDGLKKHLENQTGINSDFIHVKNIADQDHSYLRISFDSIAFADNAELAQGITITKNGNCLEETEAAKAITKSVLYYTTEDYRESKNCMRVVGTVPSQDMCVESFTSFIQEAIENKKNGNLDCVYEESLFGHQLRFEKHEGSFWVLLDGKELDFPDGPIIKSLTDMIRDTMLDKETGDYTHQSECELSDKLHAIAKAEVEPVYFVKYNGKELEEKFNKLLNDITNDGGEPKRDINFHGHNIEIHLDNRAIQSITLDGEDVYRNIDGVQEIDKIAEHVADSLGEKLAAEDMYRYDEALEKLEDSINFTNPDMQSREKVSDFEQSMEYDDREDDLEQ